MQHRTSKSVRPKLWFRWLNFAQAGKQPSGREVSFGRYHSFTVMSVWCGGKVVKTVIRRHPRQGIVTPSDAMHIRDTEHAQPQREPDGDILFA